MLCSALSRSVGEQLFGTVKRTETWFLLEYPYPMGEKAFEESDLSQPVKARLSTLLQTIPASRLLLIKRDSLPPGPQRRFFVAQAGEQSPRLYEFSLEAYEDLLDLDFPAILASEPEFQDHLHPAPLFLICTNGKRDPCCAKWGLPLYQALSRLDGGSIWQTSHLGGHRFAPNLLCFPHGLYFGRASLSQGKEILEDYRCGQIAIEHYRGRACYPPEVQAGEYFLRSQTGIRQVEAFHLAAARLLEPGSWEIDFIAQADQKRHRLQIRALLSDFEIFESCHKPEVKSAQLQYHLEEYHPDIP